MISPTPPERISHYRILNKLGAGGMGEVFLAEDTRLGRKVAIKFVLTEMLADQSARKRLVREARATARLDHPGVCSVYEVGEDAGRSFIVMQYLQGETLATRMRRKSLDLEEVLDIAVQVANTLADVHAQGIIHRDIKPANIMLLARGHVKLLDFGLARVVSFAGQVDSQAETQSAFAESRLLGTFIYMSPEQLQAETMDSRSDIFSFGVMLYEMANGFHPFVANTVADSISAILTREPLPSGRYPEEVSPELNWIITKTLRKNREQRYQTAKGLLADLKNLKHRLEFKTELERFIPSGGKSELITAALKAHPIDIKRRVGGSANRKHRDRKGSRIDSLAVLPLVNTGANHDLEYLSDGISESIINSLSHLQKLRVVPRNTMFRYRGQAVDPEEIGAAVGARLVLMGRVLSIGNHVVIGIELVDVVNNSQLWGKHYHREPADIFAVQEEIAQKASEELRLTLTNVLNKSLSKSHRSRINPLHDSSKCRYLPTPIN